MFSFLNIYKIFEIFRFLDSTSLLSESVFRSSYLSAVIGLFERKERERVSGRKVYFEENSLQRIKLEVTEVRVEEAKEILSASLRGEHGKFERSCGVEYQKKQSIAKNTRTRNGNFNDPTAQLSFSTWTLTGTIRIVERSSIYPWIITSGLRGLIVSAKSAGPLSCHAGLRFFAFYRYTGIR